MHVGPKTYLTSFLILLVFIDTRKSEGLSLNLLIYFFGLIYEKGNISMMLCLSYLGKRKINGVYFLVIFEKYVFVYSSCQIPSISMSLIYALENISQNEVQNHSDQIS